MTLDIHVGDLVKATSKQYPEEVVQGRVVAVNSGYLDTVTKTFARDRWDIEVLDRPLPPIDEELLKGVKAAYGTAAATSSGRPYSDGMTAVINFVREYDQKNATKENA